MKSFSPGMVLNINGIVLKLLSDRPFNLTALQYPIQLFIVENMFTEFYLMLSKVLVFSNI